jgi:hypothetical protein
MNDTRNRDKPASAMTKREELVKWRLEMLLAKGSFVSFAALAQEAVRDVDTLFDALMPHELRDDFDHEGHP